MYRRKKCFMTLALTLLLAMTVLAVPAFCSGQDTQGGTFAFVSKSMGNPYNIAMARGFEEVIEAARGECVICHPANPYADDQIPVIASLISQKVDTIAIAADDAHRLTEILTEAADAGIEVITVDSDTEALARTTFCNQASENVIARTLLDAVSEIAGGEGSFAIVSTTPEAVNQNAWIAKMKNLLENEEKYSRLTLEDVVYGEDREDASKEVTEKLLEEMPSLKVICAPTVAGMPGVAQAIEESASSVKLTGLGMPSTMGEYVGEDLPCPSMFLWNPEDLGRLAAYTSLELYEGEITGQEGDEVQAGQIQSEPFKVVKLEGDTEGTQILLDQLVCFDAENISQWEKLL